MNIKTRLPILFISPTLVLLATLALIPLVYAIMIAFQNQTLMKPDSSFVGLENFFNLFSDRRFINSLKISFIWEIVTVSFTMILAIFLGILIHEKSSPVMNKFLTLLLLIPVLLPRVAAAFVWKFALHPIFGLFTYPYKLITNQSLELLSNPSTALYTVAMVDVWQWGSFFAIIILKLIETLPREPFDAARLDNAKTWEIHFYISLPMLKAPLIVLMFVKMIESLRSFDLIYVITRGGPGITTETLDMYAFSLAFIENGKVSYASSMSILMMILTAIIFTVFWKRVSK